MGDKEAGLGVILASLLTAAVSCGLALNCAPATVSVYVYQSNAMCLCYMALWTRRHSKTHRFVECGARRRVYGPFEHVRKMKCQMILRWTARKEQTKGNFKAISLISPVEHLSPETLTGLQSDCDREKHYISAVLSFHHSDKLSSHNFCEQ